MRLGLGELLVLGLMTTGGIAITVLILVASLAARKSEGRKGR